MSNAAAILGLSSVVLMFASGGFHYENQGSQVSVAVSPECLAAWPLFLLSAVFAFRTPSACGESKARWWRNGLALFVDFSGLLLFLALPLAAFLLSLELGHFPPPWDYSGQTSESGGVVASLLFLPVLAAFWAGLGFALHPAVTTPGQLVAGISANVRSDVSRRDLALRGVFAYYGLFVPLFRSFAGGLEASSNLRSANEPVAGDSR